MGSIEQYWAVFSSLEQSSRVLSSREQNSHGQASTLCLPSFLPSVLQRRCRIAAYTVFYFLFITFLQIILPLSLHRCFIIILVVLPIVLSICCLCLSPSEFFSPTAFQSNSFLFLLHTTFQSAFSFPFKQPFNLIFNRLSICFSTSPLQAFNLFFFTPLQ